MVILCQEFEVEHVDNAVIVQVCGGGDGCVVAHADGHGIELVNNTIVVNVACQQCDGWLGNGGTAGQCDLPLSFEETTGNSDHGIGPCGSRELERAIVCGGRRYYERSA